MSSQPARVGVRFIIPAVLIAGVLAMASGCRVRPPRDAVTILPLGDSITHGTRHFGSYRRPLWKMLRNSGVGADFVGSRDTYWDGVRSEWDYDPDHEGHWGIRADQVLAGLDGWLGRRAPDIALIHLGTNDLAAGEKAAQIVSDLDGILVVLRRRNPRVAILLAQIIPMADVQARPRFEALNRKIAELAQARSTASSPVICVDQFTGFDAERLTYDRIHPTVEGNRQIAEKWFEALKTLKR